MFFIQFWTPGHISSLLLLPLGSLGVTLATGQGCCRIAASLLRGKWDHSARRKHTDTQCVSLYIYSPLSQTQHPRMLSQPRDQRSLPCMYLPFVCTHVTCVCVLVPLTDMHACLHIHIHVCIHSHACHMYICLYVCVRAWMFIHAYMCITGCACVSHMYIKNTHLYILDAKISPQRG